MATPEDAEKIRSATRTSQSALLAFVALVGFTFRRQWRVRQMGWAAVGLTAVLAATVAVVTHQATGWHFKNRPARVADRTPDGTVLMNYDQYIRERLTMYQAVPGPPDLIGIKFLLFAPPRAMLSDADFQADWRFLTFTRWVVLVMFLAFLLPLFSLAFASGTIGGEREGRTLIWLMTRPLPRWAVYLGTLLGVLPWCVLASVGSLLILGLVGGDVGRHAAATFWPAAAGGAVAFAALFHLIGAVFRRPAVVGLVYVFFFETLVANLPGSLKQLSLNYYVRSLMYNEAAAEVTAAVPASLDVYAPADPLTAWLTLAGATVGLTLAGMAVFSRQEPTDEI
ncbi:MAG: ABC transporter permease [Fimbriiglobus sp.]